MPAICAGGLAGDDPPEGFDAVSDDACLRAGHSASVMSLNYVIITSEAASASLARWIFSRIFRPDARQTYFFGFWLRSTR